MLTSWLSHHATAARTSISALCSTPIASMMTIFVIAATLSLPAIFFAMTTNIQKISLIWPQAGHITLYLKTPISSDKAAAFLTRVRAIPEVKKANLISAEQGLVDLQKQEGMQDILRYLPENPLPVVIEIDPIFDVSHTEKIQQLYSQLKAYPQVEQAKLDMQWVHRLEAMFDVTSVLVKSLLFVLGLAVLIIIGNTLALAIQARKEIIQVQVLIGAKDAYIIRPFLYLGISYGLVSAVIAVIFVAIFMSSLATAANQLFSLYHWQYALRGLSISEAFLFILLSALLGWVGARVAVQRQLRIIR